MTKTQELVEAARVALGGVTDYSLAKTLEIPRARISEYVRGEQNADTYACVRLAIVLNIDPLEIIAQVETESARTQTKREFWSRFPSGLRRTALGVGLSAIFVTSALGPRIGEAASPKTGMYSTSHNGRLRQRRQNDKSPARGFFYGEIGAAADPRRDLGPVPERDRRSPGRPG